MVTTKSLFLKSFAALFLLNSFSCMAMDLSQEEVPKSFSHKGIDPQENYSPEDYLKYINRHKIADTKLFEDIAKNTAEAKEKEAEQARIHENERIAAATPTQQSTYASPLLGSQADRDQAECFKSQAKYYDAQTNSLQYSNLYTISKDITTITAQLIAPSISPALAPIILDKRIKYLGKTTAEEQADKDADEQKQSTKAFNLASIKETESRELVSLAATLQQLCGNSGSTMECKQSAQLLAELTLKGFKDLERRQKETSAP